MQVHGVPGSECGGLWDREQNEKETKMERARSLLLALLLVAFGYEISYWVKGTNARAQESLTVSTSKFQIVKTNWGPVILDSTGRAFLVSQDKIVQMPLEVCKVDDCTTRKFGGLLQ